MSDFLDTSVAYYCQGVFSDGTPASASRAPAPAVGTSSGAGKKELKCAPKPTVPLVQAKGAESVPALPSENKYVTNQKDLQELCKRRFFLQTSLRHLWRRWRILHIWSS